MEGKGAEAGEGLRAAMAGGTPRFTPSNHIMLAKAPSISQGKGELVKMEEGPLLG